MAIVGNAHRATKPREVSQDETALAAFVSMLSCAPEARSSVGMLDGIFKFIDEFPDGLIIWDREDRFVYCNARHKEYHPRSSDPDTYIPGRSYAEILRHRIQQGEYPEAIGREKAWYAHRMAARRIRADRREYQLADGRWIGCRSTHLPSGFTVGISTDITERKRKEQLNAACKADLRLIAEASPAAIVIAGVESGQVRFCNPGAERLFGYEQGELLNTPVLDLYDDPERRPQIIAFSRENGGAGNHELRLRKSDGSRIWVQVSLEIISYAGEECALAAISDITRQHEKHELLRRRNLELTTLHSLSNIGLKTQSLREACQEIVDTIGLSIGFPYVALELFDRPREISGEPTSGAEPVAGLVVRTVAPPLETDPAYETKISVPITSGRMHLGSLTLAHPEPMALAETLPWWAETLANTLSNILQKIDAEENSQNATRRYRKLAYRFETAGAGSLSDADLLEMFLLLPRPEGDTALLAAQLLSAAGGLSGRRDPREAHAAESESERLADYFPLLPILEEIADRASRERFRDKVVLTAWDDLVDHCQRTMGRNRREEVRGIFLNAKNILIADEFLADGTPNTVSIGTRMIARRAVELDATAVILVHNHPSGDVSPSDMDIRFTRGLDKALEALGITLHDHLVVSADGATSFRDLGLL